MITSNFSAITFKSSACASETVSPSNVLTGVSSTSEIGGAYGIGFAIQLVYGFIASGTTFKITPFVVMALCAGVFLANETTLKTLKKIKGKI